MEDYPLLKIGIIGSGGIAGFIHIPGFQLCPNVEVAVACDSSAETAEATAHAFNIPATTTDYREVIANPEIDAVVIATPNSLHHPITLEALSAGKHVLCEKPIGINAAQAEEMALIARQSGLVHAVSFVYRLVPALRYLKHLVDEGYLGDLHHFRATYLVAVPNIWFGWRCQKELAGIGVVGDLGSHLIDFGRHLVGEIDAVSSWVKTILPQRRIPGTDRFKECTTDDSAAFLAEFGNGVTGVFEVALQAPGRGGRDTDYQYIELNGSKGTAVYHLQEPFQLRLCPGEPYSNDQLFPVPVPRVFHKLPDSPRDVRADAPNVGFRYDQAFAFIQAIRGFERVSLPDFEDGLAAQLVVDAVIKAASERCWVKIGG